jgi:RNA polymerase sigma factor (sigma-70 family)
MAIETLGAALRQIDRLFTNGAVTGFSDAQLLERFVTDHDEVAFETLLARHGPMVLSVCRGILNDPNDAEDAFQATFLILVKKAGTFRGPVALAGWLYLVAHRVAIRANAAARRRRVHERQAAEMTGVTKATGPAVEDELLRALHEEIARLPEKYRLPILLCDLEGLSQGQAARQLNWSERTLRRRLAEARDRLKGRLARRGLTPDGAILSVMIVREARASLPMALNERTVRAALDVLNHTVTAGAVSNAAQSLTQEVLKIMMIQNLKLFPVALLCVGLMAWGTSAAWVSGEDEPRNHALVTVARQASAAATAARQAPQPDLPDETRVFPVRGRVLDPDGKPVAGAGVYVRHYTETQWLPIDSMAARKKGRVAATDADGRFHFELDKAAGDGPIDGRSGWHKAQIAAAAPGFAPAWVEAGDLVQKGEATLRLLRDDVPVRGRILDPQGRPVAGVVVRIRAIYEVKDGLDLDAVLASGNVDQDWSRIARYYGHPLGSAVPTWQADPAPLWPGGRNAWTSDADGRFEVRGVGRDRIARLEFHGGGVADGTLDVMARAAKTPPKARPGHAREMSFGKEDAFIGIYPQGTQLVDATFDFIASPTKPFTGILRLKGTGKPIEGAVVRVVERTTHTSVLARTDAAGRFRLEGVPKGAFYQVNVYPRSGIDRFLSHTVIVDDTEGLKPIEQVIELSPGVIVTGRLIDKTTGRAIQPAQVMYVKAPDNLNPGDGMGFTRRPDAVFAMTVPPGHGLIAATASVTRKDDPYVGARLRDADRGKGIGGSGDGETDTVPLHGHHSYLFINVAASVESFAVELELTRGGRRKGKLVDPTGKPVTGARVYGQTSRWGNVQSLDADSFEVYGLDRSHPRLVLFAHKDLDLVGSVILKDDEINNEAPLVVRMERAGSVKGRLVGEDGQPLSGAKLGTMTFDLDGNNLPGSMNVLWPEDGLWPENETFTADANGRFQVDGLKRDAKTSINVFGMRPNVRDNMVEVLNKLTVEPGEVRDLGDVKVKAAAE